MFSILFEVADKSFRVADKAILPYLRWGQGECYKRVVYPEVRAEGGRTPGTERLNEMQRI